MIKQILLIGLLLTYTLGLTASTRVIAETEIIEVTDFRSKKICLKKPANRVVCLIESSLSGIYMLGAESQVIGISSNVYEPSLFNYYSLLDQRIAEHQIPAVGNWDGVSIERVVALKPDLVIIWASQSETIQQLEKLGIPVYGVMLHSYEGILQEIVDLGLLLGKSKRAQWLVDFSSKIIDTLYNKHHESKKVAYFMWPQGINHTSGQSSTVNDLFKYAGVLNACPLPDEHVVVNLENILIWNPDLIVMWPNANLNIEGVLRETQLKSVQAIQEKQVFVLPHSFLCDLWTLKALYSIYLVNSWAYAKENNTTDANYTNYLLNKLYNTQLNWYNEE